MLYLLAGSSGSNSNSTWLGSAEVDHLHAVSLDRLLSCLRALNPPWLAVYGDSLTRGIFFDVVSMLNGTDPLSHRPHPGHSANFSDGCLRFEQRPPTGRTKCGAFGYHSSLPASSASLHPGQLAVSRAGGPELVGMVGGANPSRGILRHIAQETASSGLWLSYRLKTFTWEADYDEEWLEELRTRRRLPSILLLGFGVWDMQYPPGSDPDAGLPAFRQALSTFLTRLEHTIHAVHRSIARREQLPLQRVQALHQPRIVWMTLLAISSRKLPAWKRPRMSAELAKAYNEAAEPELRRRGIHIIDAFPSSRQGGRSHNARTARFSKRTHHHHSCPSHRIASHATAPLLTHCVSSLLLTT